MLLFTATITQAMATTGIPDCSLADGPLSKLVEEDARSSICGGKVLLRIRLACDEVAALKEPAPLLVLASRLAYLPLLFDDVFEHFQACLPPRMGHAWEIWFDYDNLAMKWHYPLGVLCDLLVGRQVPAPLDLTVHFRGRPGIEVAPFTGIGDLQRAVMNSLRQAVFLQHGSAAPFMRLPKQQQTQLWDSISKSDLDGHAEAVQELLCPCLGRCKSLAVRLHIHGPPHSALLHPAPALTESDALPTTVQDFLRQAMPPLLDESGDLAEGVELLAHGAGIPLDTPLYWLALHAAYLDQFIHLVARVPAELLVGTPVPDE